MAQSYGSNLWPEPAAQICCESLRKLENKARCIPSPFQRLAGGYMLGALGARIEYGAVPMVPQRE